MPRKRKRSIKVPKKRTETPEVIPSDFGTEELQGQYKGQMVEEKAGKHGGKRKRNTIQVPLDFYYRKNSINYRQYSAGVRLYQLFLRAGMIQRITPSYNVVGSRTTKDAHQRTDRQYAALSKWREALDAIAGDNGKVIAVNVCCYGFLLKDINLPYYSESYLLTPRFKEVLDDLAEFFGIPEGYDSRERE